MRSKEASNQIFVWVNRANTRLDPTHVCTTQRIAELELPPILSRRGFLRALRIVKILHPSVDFRFLRNSQSKEKNHSQKLTLSETMCTSSLKRSLLSISFISFSLYYYGVKKYREDFSPICSVNIHYVLVFITHRNITSVHALRRSGRLSKCGL